MCVFYFCNLGIGIEGGLVNYFIGVVKVGVI